MVETSQKRNTVRRTTGGTTTAYIAIRVDESMENLTPIEEKRIEDTEWEEAMEISHEKEIFLQKVEEHKQKQLELNS